MKNESTLSKLPALISVFGALILSLSIAYDYGYFMVLGISFSELPTTISDHLRGSLTWIPNTLVIIFAVIAAELFFRRLEQGMTEEEIIQSSSTPEATARFRGSVKYAIIIITLLMIFKFILSIIYNIEFSYEEQHITSIIIWFLFHNFLFSHWRLVERTPKDFYLYSRWVPAILIFGIFSGMISADGIKEGGGTKYVFELEESEIEGTLVRAFEKYYLIWLDNNIKLISSGKVVSLYPISVENEPSKEI